MLLCLFVLVIVVVVVGSSLKEALLFLLLRLLMAVFIAALAKCFVDINICIHNNSTFNIVIYIYVYTTHRCNLNYLLVYVLDQIHYH